MSRSNSNESQLFDIGHSTNVKMIRVECHCFMIDKVKDKFSASRNESQGSTYSQMKFKREVKNKVRCKST